MGVRLGTLVQKEGSRRAVTTGPALLLVQHQAAVSAANLFFEHSTRSARMPERRARLAASGRTSRTRVFRVLEAKPGVKLGTMVQKYEPIRWVNTGPSTFLLQHEVARRGRREFDAQDEAPKLPFPVPPIPGPKLPPFSPDLIIPPVNLTGTTTVVTITGDANLGHEGQLDTCRKAIAAAIAKHAASCPAGTVSVVNETPCSCAFGICTGAVEGTCQTSGTSTAVESGF